MQLYFSPGACSLAPHIVVHEAAIPCIAVRVDMRTHRTPDGGDFDQINPKAFVPALQLDNGEVLTECAAILQYLADLRPAAELAPAAGTWPRYRLMEWLSYISSELHKGFAPLFRPGAPEEGKQLARDKLAARLRLPEQHLGQHKFLLGDRYTVADAYLYTVLSWLRLVNMDLANWPTLANYQQLIHQRPAVQAALQAEGLKL
jgi:glutathione S-transferase